MPDSATLKRIEAKTRRPIRFEMDGDRCIALDLTSDQDHFHGLIRHHSPAEKQEILRLVCRLTGLRKLNLRRNKVGALPPEFRQLRELEVLILGSNCLGKVPEELSSLTRLKSLHLGNNFISELPSFLGELSELEYLALHKNLRIRSVNCLAGLRNLKHLNLHYISLHRLPKFICEFKKLVTLTLWNVREFPDELAELGSLEFFSDCGSPGLRELPRTLTRLKKLRMMRLFQNSLDRLPEDFGALDNLEQLSLYQNQLRHLPDSFGQLKKLQKLNLAWNQFRFIPGCLAHCPSLQWLAVFENPLKHAEPVELPAGARVLRAWPFTTLSETTCAP